MDLRQPPGRPAARRRRDRGRAGRRGWRRGPGRCAGRRPGRRRGRWRPRARSGRRAGRRCGGAGGDDREDPAGPQHPLAGGIHQRRVRPSPPGSGLPAQQPAPWQPVMARAACAGVGVPGGQQQGRAAGPQPGERPGRRVRRARSPAIARPSRTGAGSGRGQAGRRPRRPRSPPREPSGAATRSPGRENAAMTLAAARGGDRPGARPVRAAARGGQARPDAQRHAGTCPAGPRGRRARCRARPGRAARQARGRCEGVTWRLVPRAAAFSLTFTEIGFAGPFFTPAPEKSAAQGNRGIMTPG